MSRIDFIVTGWRRSGTTLFTTLLNDHPAVHCDNESFNYFFCASAHFDFLSTGVPVVPPESGATRLGIKTLEPFLVPSWKFPRIYRLARRRGAVASFPDERLYSDWVRRFSDSLVAARPLVLNVVRHALYVYVSEQIALQRREFRFRSAFDRRFALVFDIDHFSRWMESKREVEARVAYLKPPERTIQVNYDDLADADRRQTAMDEVFGRLGVEPRPVRPGTRKQLPASLADYVANYGEMLSMVRASDHSQLAESL